MSRARQAVSVAIATGLVAGVMATAASAGSSAADARRVAVTGLPLTFESNVGQADRDVRFLAHGSSHAIALTSDSAVLSLEPAPEATAPDVLRLQVVGGRSGVRPVAEAPLPGA